MNRESRQRNKQNTNIIKSNRFEFIIYINFNFLSFFSNKRRLHRLDRIETGKLGLSDQSKNKGADEDEDEDEDDDIEVMEVSWGILISGSAVPVLCIELIFVLFGIVDTSDRELGVIEER